MTDSGRTSGGESIRRKVLFSGRVQGVGFRYTTCHVARRFDVVGYVKNLPDGRVELIAEGAADEVERFQQALGREMGRNISDVVATDAGPTGEFSGFGVKY